MHALGRLINNCAILGLTLLLLAGCIQAPKPTAQSAVIPYVPQSGEQLLNHFAPVFWVEESNIDHNRIGAARATSDDNIFIDPDSAVIYAEQREFTTAKGDYTNLIYRVHFQEIPGGFAPYYLGAGKNIGLLIVVTLNAEKKPLLVTSVHTCGCYLAFIPTSFLPTQVFPEGWSLNRQAVFSENLPAYLKYPDETADQLRLQIRLRSDTHRVMDVWLAARDTHSETTVMASLRPLDSLRRLPLANHKTTSFYETTGSRAGYVKGSYKTRERLLMSWWALAWKVGQDKYLGVDKQDGPVFYTSLKPWQRDASDMRDFAGFLEYWGWGL